MIFEEQPFGVIQPIDLTEDRKEALQDLMGRVRIAIFKAANRLQMKRRTLRNRYLRGDHNRPGKAHLALTQPERRLFAKLAECEEEIIAGWVKTIHVLCVSFYESCPVVPYDDWVQESLMAMHNAVWDFNYEYEFTTLIYAAVRNRLLKFKQREQRDRGVGDVTMDLIRRAKDIADRQEISYDEAVFVLAEECEALEEAHKADTWKQVRLGSSTTADCDLAQHASDHDVSKVVVMREVNEIYWSTIEQTDLTEYQRALLWAHLSGEEGYRKRFAAERGCSRQAIRYALGVAIRKVQEKYAELTQEPVAA